MPALLDLCTAWVRRHLAWSNSRQSWQERLGVTGLLVLAGVLVWESPRLPLAVQSVLWGALLLTAAILLRRGWLRLFGPVLFYDLVRIGRRTRYFLLRSLYAVFLLALLSWIYYIWVVNATTTGDRPGEKPEFAQSF